MTLRYNTERLKDITSEELNEIGQFLTDTTYGNPDIKALGTEVVLTPDESGITFFINWSMDGVKSEEAWKAIQAFSLKQINHLIEKGIIIAN